jgi:hypothetical protein
MAHLCILSAMNTKPQEVKRHQALSERVKKSFWLSVTAFDLITDMARAGGVSRTAIIERAVRDFAKHEGFKQLAV